jgi:purine-nucleoside phosphorylase
LKAVFYQEALETLILKKADHIYIPLSQYEKNSDGLKVMIRLLKDKKINEIFIIDECEVFYPEAKEEYFIITDHINSTGDNPLIGPNDESVGTRFPDMTFPYSEKLSKEIKKLFKDKKIKFKNTILYGSNKNPPKADIKKLISLNCQISNFNIMWLDILARHAGIEVGAVGIRKK